MKYFTLVVPVYSGYMNYTFNRANIIGIADNNPQIVACNVLLDSGASHHINFISREDALKQLEKFDETHKEKSK